MGDLVIHTQRIRGVSRNALYKSTFTYLLTYMTLKITVRQLETAALRFFAMCAAAQLRGTLAGTIT